MDPTEYTILSGHELNVDCRTYGRIIVRLIQGSVDVNGFELVNEAEFVNTNFTLFAWFDSVVEIQGEKWKTYDSTNCMTPIYLDIHKQIQLERNNIIPYSTRKEPRVMILGGPNSGKFTLAQTLLAYAIRDNESPMYVDLDVCSGNITVPECLSAVVVNNESHIDKSVMKSLLSPYVLYYGYPNAMDNVDLFLHSVTRLAKSVDMRLKNDYLARHGGVLINGGSWYKKKDAEGLLEQVIKLFHVDIVLCINDDRIVSTIQSMSTPCQIQMIRIAAAQDEDEHEISNAIKQYFYGYAMSSAELSAFTITREFREYQVFSYPNSVSIQQRSGYTSQLDDEKKYSFEIHQVDLQSVKHHILAVTDAKDKSELRTCSILGFVCVTSIDEANGKLQFLSPQNDIPGNILIMGTVTWLS